MSLAISPVCHAQGLTKAEKKEAQKSAKDLTKDGWKVQGLGNIEGGMLRLMERQANGETLLVGAALGGYQNFNTALANCKAQAVNEYVQLTGHAIVKGRIATEVAKTGGVESDNLVDMAEQNFIKELERGIGMPALKLVRSNPSNGLHEMQCWWLLNENKMEQILE